MRTTKRNNRFQKAISIISSIAVICVAAVLYLQEEYRLAKASEPVAEVIQEKAAEKAGMEIPLLQTTRSEQIIQHLGYTVSYNPEWRIPNWAAYELTAEEVAGDLGRSDKFLPDPMVEGDPVVTKDYSNSGYDRGHMAPAADMKWSEQAMKESFYTTNICPQHQSNNAGDWKDLEELVRDLATRYGAIYICCGPIVTNTETTIGNVRKIVVPQAFYKVLLRHKSNGEWTAIGFIMPNQAGNKPLMTYMTSIDEAERQTGIDFFPALPDEIENTIEADYNFSDWTIK